MSRAKHRTPEERKRIAELKRARSSARFERLLEATFWVLFK